MRCGWFIQPLLFSALMIFIILGCVSPRRTTLNTGGPTMTPTPSPTPGFPASPTPSPTASPSATPFATPMSGMSMSGELQLSARGAMAISGVQAELRGNFEQRPGRTSLDGRFEDINMPIGSAVSFCLMHGEQTIPLGVGIIQPQDQARVAEFHIRTGQGQNAPSVQAGDVLQARDGANVTTADCSRPLLVAVMFVRDNGSGSSGS